ncbi:MAG: ABC transporter permease, partial [Planctomycetales bacterium]
LALVFALSLGLAAGVISALHRQSLIDVSVMAIATVGMAVPNFWLASVCIVIFAFVFHIVPAAGWGSISHVILPALCLGAPYAAYIARLTRTGMLDVLHLDYIRTAYAKGLLTPTVVTRHAIKGAVLPVVSFIGPATAGILTGSLVLEKIFNIPGMGSHFIKAAFQRDYPLEMGVVLVYTILLFSMNTLVDIAYSVLDPRVNLE